MHKAPPQKILQNYKQNKQIKRFSLSSLATSKFPAYSNFVYFIFLYVQYKTYMYCY